MRLMTFLSLLGFLIALWSHFDGRKSVFVIDWPGSSDDGTVPVTMNQPVSVGAQESGTDQRGLPAPSGTHECIHLTNKREVACHTEQKVALEPDRPQLDLTQAI